MIQPNYASLWLKLFGRGGTLVFGGCAADRRSAGKKRAYPLIYRKKALFIKSVAHELS